jgi:GNAT superfamily N-acetyltransferase
MSVDLDSNLLRKERMMVGLLTRNWMCRCLQVIRKLGKVPGYACRALRTRGIRGAIHRLAAEWYLKQEYIVTYHDLRSQAKIPSPDPSLDITEITQDQIQEIMNLCRVWPTEFGHWRPEHLKEKILRDLDQGHWCLCARDHGNIVGAVWMLKDDELLEHCPVRHTPGERVVGRTFVVPEARGMGLSHRLYDHTIQVARERGVPQLFGFTFPRRVASVKSKLHVGFKVIGTVTVTTRFGKSTYTFADAAGSGNHSI